MFPPLLARTPWRLALMVLVLCAASLAIAGPAHAASFTVTKTTDTADGACDTDCSLREAVIAANAAPGADTIDVPAGNYVLVLNPGTDENAALSGDLDITSDMTVNGAGRLNTIITANDADRVLDINPLGGCGCTVNLTGLTITGGRAFASNFNVGGAVYIGPGAIVAITDSAVSDSHSDTSTGGGIENRGSLTLTGVTMSGNTAGSLGGAVNSIGNLSVSRSTFTGSRAESGGALYLNSNPDKTTTITQSTFSGNSTATTAGGAPDNGGAIAIDTDNVVSITKSTFTGNTAANAGGALSVTDSATLTAVGGLTGSFNRISGNSASGSGSGLAVTSGPVTLTNSWWGCNAGPASAPCDRVSGTATTSPWLTFTHTADPTSIDTGGASTLTVSFLTNSSGQSVPAADLGALVGLPVGFGSAVLGSVSPASTTIGSTGTATSTFTAGNTGGNGGATATVSAQSEPVSVVITTTRPSTTVESIDRTGSQTTNASTVSWTVAFTAGVAGLTASNFSLAVTGLGGSPQITDVSPVGATPAASWTVTASTGSGVGTLRLDLRNDTGLSHSVTGLPFTGQTYEVDRVSPGVTINQSATQADPTAGSPISFVAAFSERVTGFTDPDVTIAGTAGATTASVTEIAPTDGTTYRVDIIGMSASGTVFVNILAGAAQDAAGNVSTASTSIDNTVTWVLSNRAPDAVDDSYQASEDTQLVVASPGVLSNDTDPDGDQLTAVVVTQPTNASAFTFNADGSFSYTPRADWNGADSFTYQARDTSGALSGTATVSISVTAVDDPPTATVVRGGSCVSDSSGTILLGLSDVDSSATAASLTAVSSNQSLVPTNGIAFGGTGATRTMTVTGIVGRTGRATITVTVRSGQVSTSLVVTYIAGTNKRDRIDGTSGTDLIFGANDIDTIDGAAGNDLVCGGAGDDVLAGGEAADTVEGGTGNDRLSGGAGDDILRGGLGNDVLTGGTGADDFSGGPGNDQATDVTSAQGDSSDGTIP